jgi:hypothetical protein
VEQRTEPCEGRQILKLTTIDRGPGAIFNNLLLLPLSKFSTDDDDLGGYHLNVLYQMFPLWEFQELAS